MGFFVWPEHRPSDIAGWPAHYAALLLSSVILWGAISSCLRIHKRFSNAQAPCAFRLLLGTVVLWAGATAFAIFLLKLQSLSRQFTITYLTLAGLGIIMRHRCETYALCRITHLSQGRVAIIFGRLGEGTGLKHMLSRLPAYAAVFHEPDLEAAGIRSIGDYARGNGASLTTTPDVFVLAGGHEAATVEEAALRLLKQLSVVHIVPALVSTALFRYSLDEVGGIPVVKLASGRLDPWQAVLKRSVDVAVALLALLALAPLMMLIAVAIRLTSAGPIFFRQERLGKDGQCFRIYKFRTMQADAEVLLKMDPQLYSKYAANNFKLPKEEDFRVTSPGRLLRSSSLDELPQLINVLKGDMSLVGPRPIIPVEIERYSDYAALLLSVKPGMTGYWQVSGRSLISDYAARVRLDMEYIRDQSLRADFEILLKTVSTVTRMEGAH